MIPKSQYRPQRAQYSLSREAKEGIQKVHGNLLARGAMVEVSYSAVNSPILPVKKAGGSWRLV